ncbi:MAG: glutathione S-transferase [Gammaproteobacteria bacterium]|nr:glutathione S-transferase [Gammaproteobacteria bacterium]
MKLYDMQMAPNPRRVRIFLAEKGLDVELVEINLMEGENLGEDFLKINPRGTIPTLELDDGTYLDETVAICRYLEELHPQPNLLGTDALSKGQTEACQRHVEFDGLQPLLENFRNTFPAFSERGVPGLPAEYKAIPELAERGQRRYQLFMKNLNDRLADHKFIAGDTFSIADITALCTIDFAKVMEIELAEDLTHARRWYDDVSSRESASS